MRCLICDSLLPTLYRPDTCRKCLGAISADLRGWGHTAPHSEAVAPADVDIDRSDIEQQLKQHFTAEEDT